MRIPTILRTALALSLGLSALSLAGQSRADEEFDVTVQNGHVTVTAKGHWHINKDYPWRFQTGDTKLDKSKFTLSEQSASVDAPKGEGTIRGGVCNGDQCLRIEKKLTVN